ncbi:MAG TPA: organic hydroperoxide resistance protein [Ensifer sp.]|nr:organic hydroperoxide resistance protein [Ensifer sp.]
MSVAYTANATATGGGRNGHTRSDDGVIDLNLTVPKGLGGDGARGSNPEQLFAAGYAACFMGALRYVAGQAKVKLPEDTAVSVSVGIGPRDGGFEIHPAVSVSIPGFDRAQAEELVAKAHQVCPYSHAMRTPKEVTAVLA